MIILYRILGVIVNITALYLAMNMLLSLAVLFSSPMTILGAFAIASIILYAWFSARFQRDVLQRQKPVKHSLRDWIRVNGIVALIYSFFIMLAAAVLLPQPEVIAEQLKKMGITTVPLRTLRTLLGVLLAYGIILSVHVLWTFSLIKKNIGYFTL